MSPKAIIFAVGAALLGALIWAGISATTGFEIGWIAWGIGGAVGFGAHLGESKGAGAGTICAALAVTAILAGKALAVQFAAPAQIAKAADSRLTRELHAEYMTDAEAYAEVAGGDEVRQFMIDYGYSDAESSDDVSFEEKFEFEQGRGVMLLGHAESQPGFDEWKQAEVEALTEEILENHSFVDRIKNSVGLFDAIFILLGVSTAFKPGSASED